MPFGRPVDVRVLLRCFSSSRTVAGAHSGKTESRGRMKGAADTFSVSDPLERVRFQFTGVLVRAPVYAV